MLRVTPHDLVVQGKPARLWRGGSGDPLILIHGGVGDAELHWGANFETLTHYYDVIAPDLPGFGVTDPLPQPSFQAYLDWLNVLLESHRLIDRLRVIGHSFGAAVARLFAAAHPDEVSRLTLVDGGALPEAPGCLRPLLRLPGLSDFVFEWMRRRTYSRDGLKRMIYDEALLTPALIARAQKASYGFVAAMRQIATTRPPMLRTPTCPTLVVWGANDRLSPPGAGRVLAQVIPGARFHVIKRAGHLPQFEQPDAFHELVLKFLSG